VFYIIGNRKLFVKDLELLEDVLAGFYMKKHLEILHEVKRDANEIKDRNADLIDYTNLKTGYIKQWGSTDMNQVVS
jgi:hypothetical protein